jgi:hypothetical protein
MKKLILKAGDKKIVLEFEKNSMGAFHLEHEMGVLVTGWHQDGRFGINKIQRELFFFTSEIKEFLSKQF